MAAQDEDGRWQQKTASRQVAEETRQAGRQAEGRFVQEMPAALQYACAYVEHQFALVLPGSGLGSY